MAHRILSVTFEVDADSHSIGRFAVPAEVCEILELSEGDHISLFIDTPAGTYAGIKCLESGSEVYGTDMSPYVAAGQRIRVTASRPEM